MGYDLEHLLSEFLVREKIYHQEIVIFVPFFGNLNDKGFFKYFLRSCGLNDSLLFIIFTDDLNEYSYPKNVIRFNVSYKEFTKYVRNKSGYCIASYPPYKICDFRPMFGYLFRDFINTFGKIKYWGHCDTDVVFGKVDDRLRDITAKGYDKIYERGHFSLYKNCEAVNCAFKSGGINHEGRYLTFHDIFSSPEQFAFDETNGISKLFMNQGLTIYKIIDFFDVSFLYRGFYASQPDCCLEIKEDAYFKLDDDLYAYGISSRDSAYSNPFYIHLQKRKFKDITTECDLPVYFIPEGLVSNSIDHNFVAFRRFYRLYFLVDSLKKVIRRIRISLRIH